MKLNKKVSTSLEKHKDATVNYEGAISFNLEPKKRLVQIVLGGFFGEDKFYKAQGEDASDLFAAIKDVAKEDPEFLLKLAMFARNEMNLRTIAQVLLVEAANSESLKGKGYVKKYAPKIIRRADEIKEVLAYQLAKYKKPIPNGLIRGLKDSFNNFDAYQFGKYNGEGEISFKDAVLLVHPKPSSDERAKLYKKLITNTLESPKTWETILSNWKSKFESKKEAWESIVDMWTKKDVKNYFALIRNVRNLLDEQVDVKTIEKVTAAITNEEAIAKSKLLPFRYFSARKELDDHASPYAGKIVDALTDGLELSLKNLPTLKGITALAADQSGSMDNPVSGKGKVTARNVGNLMCGIAHKLCEVPVTLAFADRTVKVNLSQRDSVLTNMQKMHDATDGGTQGWTVIKYLLDNNIKVDRIIVFTDEEMYNTNKSNWMSGATESFAEYFKKYQKTVNPKVYLYMFNLVGYGRSAVPHDQKRVALISGWSEKALAYIELFEREDTSLIKAIAEYTLVAKDDGD